MKERSIGLMSQYDELVAELNGKDSSWRHPNSDLFTPNFLKLLIREIAIGDTPPKLIDCSNTLVEKPICVVQATIARGEMKLYGYGSSNSFEQASIYALIELFERRVYLNTVELDPPDSPKTWPTIDGKNIADIMRWAPNKKPENIDCRSYYPAYHLNNNSNILLSKFFLFGDGNIFPQSSSGTAVHTTYKTATLNALLELIERDTLLRNWLTQKKPTKLTIERPSKCYDEYNEYRKAVEQEHFDVSTYLHYSKTKAHTVSTVIRNRTNAFPYFFVGSGCSFNIDTAIKKSIKEVHQSWRCKIKAISVGSYLTTENADTPNKFLKFGACKQLDQYYSSEHLLNGDQVSSNDVCLETVISQTLKRYQVYVSPIGQQPSLLKAVRVFSPQALHMYFDRPPSIIPSNIDNDSFGKMLATPHPY